MKIPYELLIKYCRKQVSQEEDQEIQEWLSKGENEELFQSLKKEWIFINDTSTVVPDKYLIWEKIQDKIVQQKNRIRHLKLFRTIAAASIILVVFTVSLIVHFYSTPGKQEIVEQYTKINTKANEKLRVELIDGTQVWLNSNSSISYNDKYNIDNREVAANGEIFFDVVPSDKKFIVNTGKIRIEVLGTSFNLRMLNDENMEISLKSGEIAVFNSENNEQLFIMESLQSVVLDINDLSYILKIEETSISDVWTKETLEMYNEQLSIIFKKIEVWYGVEISCTELDLNKHYTFYLENESLQEFLELFSAIVPVTYTINGRRVYIEAKDNIN